jgi:preprotein translocase subunit SecD
MTKNAPGMATSVILATCLAFAAGCQDENAPRGSIGSAAVLKHGGTRLVYGVVHLGGTSAATEDIVQVLETRLHKAGVEDFHLRSKGDRRVELLVGTTDPDEVNTINRLLLGEGKLEFRVCARPASVPNCEEIAAKHARGEPTPEGFQWLPLFDESDASWEKQRGFLFYEREDMTPAEALAKHMAEKVVYVMRELKAADAQNATTPATVPKKMSVEILVLTNVPVVTNRDFAKSYKSQDMADGSPTIRFTMKDDVRAQVAMAALTGKHIGWRMAVVLDGRIQSAPNIQAELRDGGIITGYKSASERDGVLAVLQSSTMDADLELLSQRTIPPDSP